MYRKPYPKSKAKPKASRWKNKKSGYSKTIKSAKRQGISNAIQRDGIGKLTVYNPFPLRLMKVLRYSTQVPLTVTAGAMAYHTFRLNSLYDPDNTGVGNSPKYIDTFIGNDGGNAPYSRYRVHGARWNMKFVNTNSSQNSISYIAARVRDSDTAIISAAGTTYGEFFETPNCVVKMLMNGTNNMSVCNIKGYTDIKKILNVKDLRDVEYTSGSYNSNPLSEVLLDLHVRCQDGTTTATFQVFVEIYFYVECYEQNTVVTS